MESIIINNRIIINGVELPDPPKSILGNNVTTINDKVYANGYEFKDGKWKRTLKAFWHLWF